MDRPRNPEDAQRAERTGATPIDSDDARTHARGDESDDAIGTASYEMQRGEGGSSGDGSDDDTHAATPVGGESGSEDETHEASAVGGGTIYASAPDDATEEPLDASGMQPSPSGGGTPPSGEPNFAEETGGSGGGGFVEPERGYDIRGQPIPNYGTGESTESADASDDTYAVREGVTRAIDPDEIFSVRSDGDLTADEPHARAESLGGFNPDGELARPPDLPESVDLTSMAPDGTTVPDGTLQPTDPLGQTIDIGGGRSVVDGLVPGADALLGDRLDGGFDYDPTSPGTQDSRPGGQETTGDPSVDRAISEHDGSTISAAPVDPETGLVTGRDRDLDPPEPPTGRHDDPTYGGEDDHAPPMTGRSQDPTDPERGDDTGGPGYAMENPDADTGESETNLERVTVLRGSQVQPSSNPDDPATGVSTENWIPPADLVTMPTQEGEATATTLTSAATLGSSPVTNPTDPVLGDDGIISGGSYGGSGGGDTLDSMTAMSADDASAMGGEGEANLPIIVEPAPVGAGGAPGGTEMKIDANNVGVDMATGQVIGSAAPALAGGLADSGGMASQGDEAAMADPAAAMSGSVIGMSEAISPPPDPPPGDDPEGGPPGGGRDEG